MEMLDTSGKTKEDEGAFNLIMRDKERLLSFDEDVAFIFSHSALREGWDNPNIFQICTLREVASETERRQLVGRGVRLPVDQAGNRVTDERINVLIVIARESFERFVSGLQSEIEAEYGKDGVPPKPANARKRAKATLRKHYLLKPEFRDLWERIKHKTGYAVQVDSAKLITDVVPELDRAVIRKPRVTISKAEVIASTKDTFEAMTQSGARTAIDLAGRYPLPNLVEIMETLMEHTSPPMRLSRRTLLEIFRRTSNKQAALDNPHDFATAAVNIIKDKLADQLVEGIRYENLNEWYEMSLFNEQAVIETWEEYLVKSERPDGSEGACRYDHAIWDSETVEKPIIEALEKRNDVCLYVELPGWFTVRTPIGSYNPDWAIVIKNPEPDGEPLLYLVRETKHTTNLSELRPDEKTKNRLRPEAFRGCTWRQLSSCQQRGRAACRGNMMSPLPRGELMADAMPSLGRLTRVDPREVWGSEAGHFTPWLAQEDNLRLLGDTIGLELELEAQEQNVGPFRADLLCRDVATSAGFIGGTVMRRETRQCRRTLRWLFLLALASPVWPGTLRCMTYKDKTLQRRLTIDDVGGSSHVPPPPWPTVGPAANLRGGS